MAHGLQARGEHRSLLSLLASLSVLLSPVGPRIFAAEIQVTCRLTIEFSSREAASNWLEAGDKGLRVTTSAGERIYELRSSNFTEPSGSLVEGTTFLWIDDQVRAFSAALVNDHGALHFCRLKRKWDREKRIALGFRAQPTAWLSFEPRPATASLISRVLFSKNPCDLDQDEEGWALPELWDRLHYQSARLVRTSRHQIRLLLNWRDAQYSAIYLVPAKVYSLREGVSISLQDLSVEKELQSQGNQSGAWSALRDAGNQEAANGLKDLPFEATVTAEDGG